MKKGISLLLALIMIFSSVSALAEESYLNALNRIIEENSGSFFSMLKYQVGSDTMSVGKEQITMEQSVRLEDGTTIVPAADLLKYFDAELTEEDNNICLTQGSMKVTGRIGENTLTVECSEKEELNTVIELPVNIIKERDTLYLPLRRIAEDLFAGDVQWNDATREIFVLRNYQTKRILTSVKGDTGVLDGIVCKEKISDGTGIWVLQFDMSTPDIVVKSYCDSLNADEENIRYAEPDVCVFPA